VNRAVSLEMLQFSGLGMRKLILKCGLSPGDLVMLTAAVRDLCRYYPGRFQIDVRTSCPDLWENNPYVTPIPDQDPEAELIECSYPLINRCDTTPYHCLHGFIEFLNERLNLAIKPAQYRGDIHLSAQEKAWFSQVHEVTRQDIPFWIVAAGGKYDITIKWWDVERYQQVVDHFRGRIQFVQVGDCGHHHPKLNGVIDLRGQTSLRELIRLVYHAQGVLCSVTSLMHLAAGVETRFRQPARRPCVVIAGGREPAHWEAYPGHQFVHTNGALPCCAQGGCWKDRTVPLRDGDKRDQHGNRCVDVVNGLPRCMNLITAAEVIRRIEIFFAGGMIKYLSSGQRPAAERGVLKTCANSYDQQPLNLHNAGLVCDRVAQSIPPYPDRYSGRGIVICGGGVKYFTNAWVCINMLRRLGCKLPVQVWFLGEKEMDQRMKELLVPLGVECVDAFEVRKSFPVRLLAGWVLKPYAVLHSKFREVLFLDADNVATLDPEFLFDTPQYRAHGAIFWPDVAGAKSKKAAPIWRSCGLRQPDEPEFESGQIVLDKQRCWSALCLTLWFNENADFYYRYLHGDKETFHLAFRKLRKSYSLVPIAIQKLEGTICQHDFEGRRIFQHRNEDKWDLFPLNRKVPGFHFEEGCRRFLSDLRSRWNGQIRSTLSGSSERRQTRLKSRRLRIEAVMISSASRRESRQRTLESLSKTDWGDTPLHVVINDDAAASAPKERCAYHALKASLRRGSDYILFFEDGLEFNRHLLGNLHKWGPVRSGSVTLASLHNPQVQELAVDLRHNARLVDSRALGHSLAFFISKETVQRFVRSWHSVEGNHTLKISRLGSRLRSPVYVHAPSLVQHRPGGEVNDRDIRPASDFWPDWKAQAVSCEPSIKPRCEKDCGAPATSLSVNYSLFPRNGQRLLQTTW
jgi:ADP-heptose:LPS heptosyltransferase